MFDISEQDSINRTHVTLAIHCRAVNRQIAAAMSLGGIRGVAGGMTECVYLRSLMARNAVGRGM